MSSKDFTVVKHGVDTSGRAIYMTRYMEDWWEEFCDRLGFTPVIVQGAFMTRAGGGASTSAGYHDLACCLDLRLWDRTAEQRKKMIKVARLMAAAYYERDERRGGMDLHAHLTLIPDSPASSGASFQISEYKADRDGLASRGPDYHWRPTPLRLDWTPEVLVPTPNITTALRTKDRGTRRNALRKIVKHADSKAAVKAAERYLALMERQDKINARIRVTRARLKKQEVRL